jgi:putative holliday junction resolvase
METIPAEGAPEAIAALAAERGIGLVVVGHPVSMSGHHGERARHSEDFAQRLAASAGLTVELQDERLSSAEADRALRAAGADARSRKAAVDRSAAAVILQAWLDAHRAVDPDATD